MLRFSRMRFKLPNSGTDDGGRPPGGYYRSYEASPPKTPDNYARRSKLFGVERTLGGFFVVAKFFLLGGAEKIVPVSEAMTEQAAERRAGELTARFTPITTVDEGDEC